jgi:30S ribosomal protein S31
LESTFPAHVPIIGRRRKQANRTELIQTGDSMGRGDARTRKGKIFKGSYGKSRPHKARKTAARAGAAKAPARKGT